jgi:hypothetical protein
MAVRLSALRAGRLFPPSPERFLVLISVRGCVASRAIERLEGLTEFEKSNDNYTEQVISFGNPSEFILEVSSWNICRCIGYHVIFVVFLCC